MLLLDLQEHSRCQLNCTAKLWVGYEDNEAERQAADRTQHHTE